ncbi:MAG TPA: polyprenyl synthetase family protein [Oculatellaceae cyanobacterium]
MTTYQTTSKHVDSSATGESDAGLLTSILKPVANEIALVEQHLETNLIDDNPFVGELLGQIFKAGGKRIRVAIALLCSKATCKTEDFSRLHIILAVLTELIHTASLVHDDVIDTASTRRGQETINKRFNDRVAVLMGDLLFAQASICLARIMNPVVVGIYGQVLGDLCSGEIRQMRNQFSTAVDWQSYLRKSINKTASLFAAGSHSGAILNAQPDAVVADLKEYGLNLGLLFQLVDDLLDVTGSSAVLGKPAGGDLQSGVITAPALFILEREDDIAARLRELIKTRAVTTFEGNSEALDLIRNHGGVEKTVELCQKYATASKESLACLPPTIYKESLERLVDYVMTRTN